MKIKALLRLRRGQGHHLQLAQRLQAITQAVGLALEWGIAEFWPRFDVEEKQEPIEIAQTLMRQCCWIDFLSALRTTKDPTPAPLPEVPHRLVPQELNGLAHGIFKVLGDTIGVPVGVLCQSVEQGYTRARADG